MAKAYQCANCGTLNPETEPRCRHCNTPHEAGAAYQPANFARPGKRTHSIIGIILGAVVAVIFLMGMVSFVVFRKVSAPSISPGDPAIAPTVATPANSSQTTPTNNSQLILEGHETEVKGQKVVVVGRFLQNDLSLTVSRLVDSKDARHWLELSQGTKSFKMDLSQAETDVLRQRLERSVSLLGGQLMETLFIRPKSNANAAISIKFNDQAAPYTIKVNFTDGKDPLEFLLNQNETRSLTQLFQGK